MGVPPPVEVTVTGAPDYPVTSVNDQTGDVALDAADVGADPAGTAQGLLDAHTAAGDPHPGYLTPAEGAAAYDALGAAASAQVAAIAAAATDATTKANAAQAAAVAAAATDATTKVATETTRATAAEGVNGTAIAAEATTARAAELALRNLSDSAFAAALSAIDARVQTATFPVGAPALLRDLDGVPYFSTAATYSTVAVLIDNDGVPYITSGVLA